MKKTIILLILTVFYLSCQTAGEKTVEGKGAVDDLKLRGYTKFTIFKGRNLLGYAQDPNDPKEFPKKVWKPKENSYKSSKVEQKLLLEFSEDKMAEAKIALGKVAQFDAGASKFQKIRLILENPVEYVWEDVSPEPGANPKLLKQKYIRELLQVSQITLEFETKDGKHLKTGTDFSQYGVQLGIEAKTSESENVVFFAKNAYVGYKLADPPQNVTATQSPVVDRMQRVLIAPFVVNAQNDTKDLELLLYNATRDALNRVPNIKPLERDPGVLYTESQLKDRENVSQLRDVASLQGADLIFVGEFHRYGKEVVAQVQGFLRDSNGELVPGKTVKFNIEDMDKVQFLALGDMWEKELLTTFDKWTPGKESRSTQNELAYKEYLRGLDELAKLDDESVKKAISHFEKAVKLDPNYAEAYAMLSEAYTESVDLNYGSVWSKSSESEKRRKAELEEKALQTGNQALKLNSNLSLAHRALAKYHFARSKDSKNYVYKQDREKALSYAQKAIKLDPKDARSAWLLFFIKAEDDKRVLYDKKNTDYLRANELNPNLFESYQSMGLISEKQEEYDKAIEYYKKAMVKSPKHLQTHFDLARIYRKKKDFNESLKLFQKAELIQPKGYKIWEQYAFHYRDKKEYQKADEYYKKILEEDTENFSKVYWEAIGFYAYKPKEGIQLLESAAKKDHNASEEYYTGLAYFYMDQNDDKATIYAKKALDIRIKKFGLDDNETAYGYSVVGITFDNRREYDKAIQYYLKALDIRLKKQSSNHPDIAFNYLLIGNIYFSKKDYDKAVEYLQKSLVIRLKNGVRVSESYDALGSVYHRKGEYDKAIKYYQKALEVRIKKLERDDLRLTYSYNSIGDVYQDKREYDKAIEYYQKALAIKLKNEGEDHPDIANKYANLSQVYLFKGDKKKANELIEKAFAIGPDLIVQSELWFYRYAHFPEWRTQALGELQKLMKNKAAKSIGWDLKKNIEIAIKDGHPNPKKLKEIAKWITESK